MQNTITYVGVDISKPYFDVALPKGEKYQHYKFVNKQTGFSALLKLLSKDCVVVMEASGPYYVNPACFLSGKRLGVSAVNPVIIRRFAQMRMVRAKIDKKDACIIAAYGKRENPPRWVAPQPHTITM